MNSVENTGMDTPAKAGWKTLFWVSLLSLFIEILLIRHLAAEIRIFAYFKNLALIGAFLGLGFGYLYRRPIPLYVTALCLAAISVASHPGLWFKNISAYLSQSDMNTWEVFEKTMANTLLGLAMLTFLFFVVIIAMIPLGQILAGIFDNSANRVFDYSINIAGALAGIWLFSLMSFMRWEPIVWYSFGFFGLALLDFRDKRRLALILAFGAVSIGSLELRPLDAKEVKWSPYQKISWRQYAASAGGDTVVFDSLKVNGVFYLNMLDLSDKTRKENPGIFHEDTKDFYYYDLPYGIPNKLDDVLVLGAGGGNDVAAALRAGAKHVTAVEIDPVIVEYGKRLHPEKPYSSGKVTLITNDGRNYIRNTERKYDLVILGLLDSHTLTSNFSNTNLDSFMYTYESVGDMKRVLKDDGVLALSFLVKHSWMGSKIFNMVRGQFGADPHVINFPASPGHVVYGGGGTYFITSRNAEWLSNRLEESRFFSGKVANSKPLAEEYQSLDYSPQTDDWPYLYIRDAAIPNLHMMVTVTLLAIFLVFALSMFGKPARSDWHFAGLGAGFLLLEVAVISRFSLFWGTTWVISSIVISMILITILVANSVYIYRGKGAPYPVIYGAILMSLGAIYMVPLTSGWVILLYMVPFVAIGLLFAQSFDNSATASKALAYNLFGSLIGGLSESFSFVYGISALILVGMAFYVFSALFTKAVHR